MSADVQTVDRMLKRWCAAVKGPALSLRGGICVFTYDDVGPITLEVPEGEGFFCLHAALMKAPTEGRERLFETALQISAYGLRSRGASLALDPADDDLVLWYRRDIQHTDDTVFANIVTNFILTAQEVGKALEAVATPRVLEQSSSGPAFPFLRV